MNRSQFFEFAQDFFHKAMELLQSKNDDYSQEDNPFSNFELIAKMIGISTKKAIFSRMADKFARLRECLDKGTTVKDETLGDTLLDLVNYSVLLAGYLKKNLDNQVKDV